MGWFEFLAEREAAKQRATAEADSAGLEEAWARVDDLDFVSALYQRLASEDPDVALAIARLRRDEEGQHILLQDGAQAIGPLVVARLATSDRERWVLPLLLSGLDLGRPLGDCIAARADRHELWASSPHASDRDRAFAMVDQLDGIGPLSVAGRAAQRGDGRGSDHLLEALRNLERAVADRALRAFGAKAAPTLPKGVPQFVVDALKHVVVPGSAPLLVALLRTRLAMDVLEALARQGDATAVPAIRAYRDSLRGDADKSAPLQVWADWALHCCGEPVELSAAHAIQALLPRRYGYPKREHLAPLQGVAARLFHAAGVEADWVASLVTSDYAEARAAGLLASPGPLDFWDEHRAKAADEAALWAALEGPRVVWRYRVVEALHNREADDARLAAWARARLESVDNHWVHYADDTGNTNRWALRVLEYNTDLHESLAGTSSAWIRAFALTRGKMTASAEPPPRPEGVHVERIDRVPFVIGHTINALALSPDGASLAVVGERFARVLDSETGATRVELIGRAGWAYEVVWSPDGTALAAAFHGGHVCLYDAATGQRTHHLQGHGGVPHGVRGLAWGPEGLISGGEDGLLIGWDPSTGAERWRVGPVPGCWQRIRLSDAGAVASHLKSSGGEENFLYHFDPATGEGTREPTKTSMWALAHRDDGVLALAGEGKGVALRKVGSTRTWRKLGADTHKNVVRVAFLDDGLHAITDDGRWTRFDVETREAAAVLEQGPPLWALDGRGRTAFAGGKGGVVHRLGADGTLATQEGASHAKRVIAVADGVSLDWNGTLLRWPEGGGAGTVVARLGVTPESMVPFEDGWVIGTRDGLRRLDSSGALLASTVIRADRVALLDGTLACSRDRAVTFCSAATLEPVGQPLELGARDVNALAAFRGGFLVGNEGGQVAWVVDGERVWEAWDHGTDGLEEGNPHCAVCSIVAAGSRFATGATDDIVRVYELDGGVPRLRWRIANGFGLFNRMALEPSGRWLAIPNSNRLMLWDLDAGTERWCLYRDAFEGEAVSLCRFEGPELVVGTEAGRLFRVRWR